MVRRVVLLLAAGAAWESHALRLLGGRRDLVVLKRCVDVDDLLATATSGQADTAVAALEAPGFDLAAVDHLRRHGVRAVAVVPAGGQVEAARVRATRIGVRSVVPDDDLGTLPDAIVSDEPEPATPPPPTTPVQPQPQQGRIVAVWGPAGAPGRTTLATALAAALGRTHRTTLVDADPYGGSVAQVLGILDEVSGLLSAARLAGAGMLEERFSSVQRGLDDHLTVVTGLPRPDRWTEVRAGTVELLLELAARHGHVVVDTGFSLEQDDTGGRPGRNRMTTAALEVADELVVVGTADPVGLSRLARALVELRESHPTARVRVVVNRMRPTIGWTERDVEQMVAGFADPVGLHFLPDDRVTVDRALVTGRTLLETSADSALVTGIGALASQLLGAGVAGPSLAGPSRAGPSPAGQVRRRRAGRARPR
jgi:MinD-like ATPase involved in chromosome partitioning or flagellar assembly